MFVRTKSDAGTGRTRVQIVKSMRTGRKVRQKILRHVGVAHNEAELEDVKRLAGRLMELMRAEQPAQRGLFTEKEHADLAALVRGAPRGDRLGADLGECREESRLTVGLRDVMGRMHSALGWDNLLGSRRRSANRILRELVLARLSQPESKRATVAALARDADISLNLDWVYQCMDFLDASVIDRIRRTSRDAAEGLLAGPVDVLFYDCTTLAFATEREDAEDDPDRLLAKGYSKDGRHHRSQVMLALSVTADGLPVSYDLFPGGRWEGDTLKDAMDSIERRRAKGGVTLVADAAMLSADNRELLRERGWPFIVGYRMRSAPAAVKAEIVSGKGYRPWNRHASHAGGEDGSRKVIKHGGARIIVTHSPVRARKDARLREKAVGKLRRKLERSRSPAGFSGRGSGRFLSFPKGGDVRLDKEKIRQDAKWDGLHAILVEGADDMEPVEAVARYRQLWEIESCFRTNKHDLKIRPVYHWTPRRIRAHVAICYMAFCCLQHLRKRLNMLGHPMSPARIRKELHALQVTVMRREGADERYALPSAVTTDARRILKCVGLTWNEAPFRLPPKRKGKTADGTG